MISTDLTYSDRLSAPLAALSMSIGGAITQVRAVMDLKARMEKAAALAAASKNKVGAPAAAQKAGSTLAGMVQAAAGMVSGTNKSAARSTASGSASTARAASASAEMAKVSYQSESAQLAETLARLASALPGSAAPVIQVTFGDVRETADVEAVADALTARLSQELNASARGLYL
ncbi:hypothetical protein [Gehongia tenuis]|uniref:Uncharacterized protein n=1 Tax=Gehongia tenuis TaxID=2763655 RepID=A0A926D2J2_9FIRM|nr:hypothetical protein [Gehongia tenuis]MBC8530573.1 hypothetical protein [Gehongia tenuis]